MAIQVGRRTFLKVLGVTAVGSSIASISFRQARALPPPKSKLIEGKKIPTICTYCAIGCGQVATVVDGSVIDIEGDKEHPVNEGLLCAKGNAQLQLFSHKGYSGFQRVSTPSSISVPGNLWGPERHHAGSNPLRIVKPLLRTNIKKDEDQDPQWKEITWEEAFNLIVERTKPVVEEFYRKNPLPNKDGNYVINGREFPVAWLGSAYSHNEENYIFRKFYTLLGGNNIDHQARRCHSTTVAALAATFGFGAMTNHPRDVTNAKVILIMGSNAAENHPVIWKWVTRAVEKGATLIVMDPKFSRSASKAHIFSWFRPGTDAAFFLGMINYVVSNNLVDQSYVKNRTNAEKTFPGIGTVIDELVKISSNYTVDEVSKITGIPPDKFRLIAETYTKTRPGTWLYAMGTTQHTNGTQMIRAGAILQLLLGNVGVPGAGVNALRGISNVQGSTDMGTMGEWLPGYRIPPPNVGYVRNFQKYKNLVGEKKTPTEIAGEFKVAPIDLRHWATYLGGYMKGWGIFVGTYPEQDPEKGTVISDLPLVNGLTSMEIFRAIKAGKIKTLIVVGENPAVSNANAGFVREALSMEGLFTVVMDPFHSETAHYADILLPGGTVLEKDGTVTNTGRLIQWRYALEAPPGEARSDLWFADQLFKRFRKTRIMLLPSEKFAKDQGIDPRTLRVDPDGRWNYGDPPDAERVLRELDQVVAIYTGVIDSEGRNLSKRRSREFVDAMDRDFEMFHNWAYSWPDNQRVLYKTDETGVRLPRALGRNFFTADRKAFIYNPLPAFAGRGYGIPIHNEPAESPDPELAKKYPAIIFNHPAAPAHNKELTVGDPTKYPIILTTYRLTEHMHTGSLSRNLPWLVELVPEAYIDISEPLAKKINVKTGDKVRVRSARKPDGIVVKAFVTKRVTPLIINNKEFEVAAMPWHWGFMGIKRARGPSANLLTIDAGDAWTLMPETKVALCNVERAEAV